MPVVCAETELAGAIDAKHQHRYPLGVLKMVQAGGMKASGGGGALAKVAAMGSKERSGRTARVAVYVSRHMAHAGVKLTYEDGANIPDVVKKRGTTLVAPKEIDPKEQYIVLVRAACTRTRYMLTWIVLPPV